MSDRLNYAAPVAWADRVAIGEFWPCHECLPWHLEVIEHPENGEILVREWHAIECPVLAELLED